MLLALSLLDTVDYDLHGITRQEFYSVIPDGTNEYSNGTLVNPSLGYINFSPTPLQPAFTLEDACLHYPGLPTKQQRGPQHRLILHPISFRSYVCFPPTRKVSIGGISRESFPEIGNHFGVTVLDVVMRLQAMSVQYLWIFIAYSHFSAGWMCRCRPKTCMSYWSGTNMRRSSRLSATS